MSEFPYATIPDYQRWTIVSEATDRRAISPQGHPKFTLPRDAKIASAGSCFAQRIAERLPSLGLNCLVAEPSAAPFSARWGTIYSVGHLAQLLDRALGRFDPLERAWETPSGDFLDPFRPSIELHGFGTIDLLEADRRKHLLAVRRLFGEIDVFVFTLGLTEMWVDARDGAVFPACPGRGRGTFDPAKYLYVNLGVEEICEALQGFLAALSSINANARVILTVSPVPIAATMEPMHIVRASLKSKSTLKVAAEIVASRHANVDYFASYDLVTANLGAENFFAKDGRHLIDAVAERVTSLFAATYFDIEAKHGFNLANISDHGGMSATDCDEDRLLALIETDRGKLVVNRDAAAGEMLAHPLPLFFVGDSGCLVFRDCLFRFPQLEHALIGRTLHTPSLFAGELVDSNDRLNTAVLMQLLSISMLQEVDRGSYRINPMYNGTPRNKNDRLALSPPVTLFCGSNDTNRLILELNSAHIDLPPELRRGYYAPRPGKVIGFGEAVAIAYRLLAPFERGLRLMRSFGISNLAVHTLPPFSREPSVLHPNPWYDMMDLVQGASITMNHCIKAICKRVGIVHIDIWSQVVEEDGWRNPAYTLDPWHLNSRAALLSVRQIVEAATSNKA